MKALLATAAVIVIAAGGVFIFDRASETVGAVQAEKAEFSRSVCQGTVHLLALRESEGKDATALQQDVDRCIEEGHIIGMDVWQGKERYRELLRLREAQSS